jgi:hypothetical protein
MSAQQADVQQAAPTAPPPSGTDPLEQLKGSFLASLNHELRTPLSGVLGMTELLLETRLDPEQQEYVQTTRQCATQLLDTLNLILTYSSLAAGSHQAETAEFHLPQLLEALAVEAKERAETKGLRFYLKIDETLPETVYGDARQVREILMQLLTNAVKFTQQGSITLRVRRDVGAGGASMLRAEVIDTGIGISSSQLAQIFESFRQLDSGLARAYSGLGLGLAVAEKLARLMGGEIQVRSALGQGATFSLLYPLEGAVRARPPAPNSGLAELAANVAGRPEPGERPRVLAVEDNVVAQQILGHILSRNGYEYDLASTGPEAIELARRNAYQMVLVDIQLPGLNGFDTADEIRKIPGRERVPVIALSANDTPDCRSEARRRRLQAFVPKPVDRRLLIDTLRSVASGK